MGYSTDGLTFNSLRGANRARLPEFKNKHGETAHAKPDGSDWTPAQWFQAVVGELGEFAAVRCEFEEGRMDFATYQERASKELADIATYLDILSLRALDETIPGEQPMPANFLMRLMVSLGEWANERKKYERGDLTREQYNHHSVLMMSAANARFSSLNIQAYSVKTSQETNPHPNGVNLGQATMDKFNEVSVRVGSRVRLEADDWHYVNGAVLTKPLANCPECGQADGHLTMCSQFEMPF